MKNKFVALLLTLIFVTAANAKDSAVILLYHHISSQTPPSTSISPERFLEHLAYIDEHFTVKPLDDVMNKLMQNQPLEPDTLVITFDDGYKNILENGHAALQEYSFPYTIFINPDRIGVERGQLTWQEVKQMRKDGVLFANHTSDHLHMLNRLEGETKEAWLNRVWRNVERAQIVLEQKLGEVPKYLAYPFGEYNYALAEKVLEQGYIGFGQHSGAVGSSNHFAMIPRFPAAGIYANLGSLKTKMHSLAMPVSDIKPLDPEIDNAIDVEMAFKVNSADVRLSQLQCFYQGTAIDVVKEGALITTTVPQLLPVGRSRVNCTAPSNKHSGRFYWYSQPFFRADENGMYPN